MTTTVRPAPTCTVAAHCQGSPTKDSAPVMIPSTSMSWWYAAPLTILCRGEFTTLAEMFWSKKNRDCRAERAQGKRQAAAAAGGTVGTESVSRLHEAEGNSNLGNGIIIATSEHTFSYIPLSPAANCENTNKDAHTDTPAHTHKHTHTRTSTNTHKRSGPTSQAGKLDAPTTCVSVVLLERVDTARNEIYRKHYPFNNRGEDVRASRYSDGQDRVKTSPNLE